MPTTGKTLRRERRAADVTATALAARMGVSRTSLWIIEKTGEVEPVRVTEYRAALAALRDATEPSEGNAA